MLFVRLRLLIEDILVGVAATVFPWHSQDFWLLLVRDVEGTFIATHKRWSYHLNLDVWWLFYRIASNIGQEEIHVSFSNIIILIKPWCKKATETRTSATCAVIKFVDVGSCSPVAF